MIWLRKDIIKYGDSTGHDECFHKDSTYPETIFLDSYGRLSVGLYNYEKKLYERVAISQNDLDNLIAGLQIVREIFYRRIF